MSKSLLMTLTLALGAVGCGHNAVNSETAALACITAAACGFVPQGGVKQCSAAALQINSPEVAALWHINASQLNCIAAAGHDCSAAKRCLAGGAAPEACSGISTSCSDNVWKACTPLLGSGGANGMQSFDCASVGQMCFGNNGVFDCAYGTCGVGSAAVCVHGDGSGNGGDIIQTCSISGLLRRSDCSPLGATCISDGVAHCRGTGASCMSNSPARCDGNVLVGCLDGQEARRDCGRLNLGCYVAPNGQANCAAGGECNLDENPVCQGNLLVFCNAGRHQTVDCVGAGFSRCSADNGGACLP